MQTRAIRYHSFAWVKNYPSLRAAYFLGVTPGAVFVVSKRCDGVIAAQNGGGYGRASRGGASDARYQPYSR